jgi:hypothetical protein
LGQSDPLKGPVRLELPAEWGAVAMDLGKKTGWRWECPGLAGMVPGPSLESGPNEVKVFRWADELASRLNRSVVLDADGKVIRLAQLPTGGRWIASHSGPFRLVARGWSRSEDFANPGEGDTRTLRVELGWEPGMEPLLVPSVWDEILVSVDGKTTSVLKNSGALREPSTSGAMNVPLPVKDLAGLKTGWTLILKGKAIVPVAMRELRLGQWPDSGEELKRGPMEGAREGAMFCRLMGISRNGRRISLRVRVEREPGGPGLESYQSWVVLNRLWMEDRLGEVLKPVGQVLEQEDERSAEITYHVVLPEGTEKRPRVIRYRTLTGVREEKLTFEFKGLPALP